MGHALALTNLDRQSGGRASRNVPEQLEMLVLWETLSLCVVETFSKAAMILLAIASGESSPVDLPFLRRC